jgi:hypothetical protein
LHSNNEILSISLNVGNLSINLHIFYESSKLLVRCTRIWWYLAPESQRKRPKIEVREQGKKRIVLGIINQEPSSDFLIFKMLLMRCRHCHFSCGKIIFIYCTQLRFGPRFYYWFNVWTLGSIPLAPICVETFWRVVEAILKILFEGVNKSLKKSPPTFISLICFQPNRVKIGNNDRSSEDHLKSSKSMVEVPIET